jgi:hypothetical protein
MEKDRFSAQDKREILVEFDPYPDYRRSSHPAMLTVANRINRSEEKENE